MSKSGLDKNNYTIKKRDCDHRFSALTELDSRDRNGDRYFRCERCDKEATIKWFVNFFKAQAVQEALAKQKEILSDYDWQKELEEKSTQGELAKYITVEEAHKICSYAIFKAKLEQKEKWAKKEETKD